MMWQFLNLIAGLSPAQWANLAFAALCIGQCLGLPMRLTALTGAALYVVLALL